MIIPSDPTCRTITGDAKRKPFLHLPHIVLPTVLASGTCWFLLMVHHPVSALHPALAEKTRRHPPSEPACLFSVGAWLWSPCCGHRRQALFRREAQAHFECAHSGLWVPAKPPFVLTMVEETTSKTLANECTRHESGCHQPAAAWGQAE